MLHDYLIEQSRAIYSIFCVKYWIFEAFSWTAYFRQNLFYSSLKFHNPYYLSHLISNREQELKSVSYFFFRPQASRLCTNTTPVNSRNYTTVTVKEFDTPSPTKSVIAKTKTRKDFATSDEETIPLCSPANTAGKHLKQH